MRRGLPRELLLVAAVGVVVAVVGVSVGGLAQRLLTLVLIAVLWAMSYNLALGVAGMPSFGHGALYGIGAYTVALVLRDTGLSFFTALPLAGVVAALAGAAMAVLGTRTTGLYFGVLTLALGQVAYLVVFQWYGLTGGANGLFGLPIDYWLQSDRTYLLVVLAVVLLGVVALRWIVASPFGSTLMAIRDNELRTAFLGVSVKRLRVAAFAISAFLTGIAGGLFVGLDQMSFPLLLHWSSSARPLLMTLIGGTYAFWGPAVGAVLLVGSEVLLGAETEYWVLVLGVLLLGLVLFMPTGIAGLAMSLWKRMRWSRMHSERTDSPSASVGSAPRTPSP